MNLKKSPFSILNKERRELDYIKGVYKRRVQSEIDSYKDSEDEDKRDTIDDRQDDSFDGFKVLNRVLNPPGANGCEIVQASDHSKIWQWC